jgi:EAL domain-containing protein (putative c-di-GMP-specific phosphodiesterase class I)/two-component sensor histidine kinase
MGRHAVTSLKEVVADTAAVSAWPDEYDTVLQGIADGEFAVRFQPQVDLRTGRVLGAEALLRWTRPTGEVLPSTFIPSAEMTGAIHQLGAFALDEACRAAAVWRDERPAHPPVVGLNVSAVQLVDPAFPDQVEAALARHRLEGRSLCLELTESVLIERTDLARQALTRLKALGVALSIDDFGTGTSSLGLLKRLPIDELKIDRSFVTHLGRDHEDAAVVEAVCRLGQALGLRVVAEGVESAEQARELRRLGCRYGQGFLWSPAIPQQALPEAVAVDEIDDRADELDDARAAADESIDMLLHELRNPLAVVRGFADLLVEAPDTVDVVDVGRRLRDRVDAVSGVLASLHDLRDLDRGTLRLACQRTDLVALAHEIVRDMPDLRHRVDVAGATSLDAIVDVPRLRQVLLNLLGNAERYTPPGSPVHVVVHRVDGEAVIEVADEGPGIPAHQVARAFTKYGRLDRARPGTGLGLYLCRGLIQAHGGRLHHRANPQGGSTFVIHLPSQGGTPP